MTTADALRALIEKATKGPWKASGPRKASNFGNHAAHVVASVPDPGRGDGSYCGVTVAKVAGDYGDERKSCDANARLIVALANVAPLIADLLAPDHLGRCRECRMVNHYVFLDCRMKALESALQKELAK